MKWRERVFAVLVGVVATLLILEGGLRVVGWVAWMHGPSGTRDASARYTVLCVGDSFTAGYWRAFAETTYPAQLERLLEKRLGRGSVRVFNRGRSGQNTYQVLQRLQGDLDDVKPDVVVLLAGFMNECDLFSYYRYCQGDSWMSTLRDSMYRLRVFKLVKLLAHDVEERGATLSTLDTTFFTGSLYAMCDLRTLQQASAEAQEHYDDGLAYWDDAGKIRAGDLASAEACFQEVLKHDGQSMGAWLALAWINHVRNDTSATARCCLEAYRVNARRFPRRSARIVNIRIMKTFQLLTMADQNLYLQLRDGLEALGQSCSEAKRDCETFVRAFENLDGAHGSLVGDWIRSDLGKMIRMVSDRGTPVVLLNYPRYNPQRAPSWDATLQAVALQSGALFIDERAVFDALPNRTSYFAEDCSHPNAAGNHIVAETVMNVILPLLERNSTGKATASATPR